MAEEKIHETEDQCPIAASVPFINAALQAITKDLITDAFQPEKPWFLRSENRTVANLLRPSYLLGLLVRYCLLVPLRLICFIFAQLILLAVVALSAFMPAKMKESARIGVFKVYSRLLLFTAGCVTRFINQPPSLSSHRVFVSNHKSMIDEFVVSSLMPAAPVGQRNMQLVPRFVQYVMSCCIQPLWFDRKSKEERADIHRRMRERAVSETKVPLYVMPEGICVGRDYQVRFRRGAFSLGEDVAVCPIVLRYNGLLAPAYWSQPRATAFLWSLMRSWCLVVEVEFLPPQMQGDRDPCKFATDVGDLIASVAGATVLPVDGFVKFMRPSKSLVDGLRRMYMKRARIGESSDDECTLVTPYRPVAVRSALEDLRE